MDNKEKILDCHAHLTKSSESSMLDNMKLLLKLCTTFKLNGKLIDHELCFYSSLAFIVSVSYAYYNDLHLLSFLNLCLLLTSLCFWVEPVNGFNRVLDYIVVIIVTSYQIFLALNYNYLSYFIPLIICSILWIISRWNIYHKKYKIGCYVWASAHVIFNINNILLFNIMIK